MDTPLSSFQGWIEDIVRPVMLSPPYFDLCLLAFASSHVNFLILTVCFNEHTFAYYVDFDKLGGDGAVLVTGEDKGAVEDTSIDAGVVEGDVKDENWAVLHIISFFTAVPGQAVIEAVIHYVACHICITVDLIVRKKTSY